VDIATAIIFVGLLVFLAHFFVALFERTRIPDVLMLIGIGLILGPGFQIVTPADFGRVGPVFVTIALVIILFEGGTGLSTDVLKRSWRKTLYLTIGSFVASVAMVAFIIHATTDFGATRSILLGAIVGGTASAVIVPMVQQLRMAEQSKVILVLESVITDVLCIVVALAFFQAYHLGELRIGVILGQTIASFLLAAALGVASAFAWSIALHKVRTLQNSLLTTPAFVFMLYGVVELLGYSGGIAALAFGVAIGNTELFSLKVIKRYVPKEPISLNKTEKILFGELVFILKTFFFVYIGLSIQVADLTSIAFGFLLTVVMFVLRIVVVWLTIDRKTSAIDASFIAVMVPKGLAAAVLASYAVQSGLVGGEFIQNVAYAVVLFSIVINSVLVFAIERTPIRSMYLWLFKGYAREEPETGPAAPHQPTT
jgi:NhaP-type Na+/H+ or K+/H+ antiporter